MKNNFVVVNFLLAIKPGSSYDSAWCVCAPDLPGCFSTGGTLEAALASVPAAISLWFDKASNMPQRLPPEKHFTNPEFSGRLWTFVDVELGRDTHINHEAITKLGITEVGIATWLNTPETCAAYLRESLHLEHEIDDNALLKVVSHIADSEGYRAWARPTETTSIMTIDGHDAVIRFDQDLELFRGEFLSLAGGADFYADNVRQLEHEGARSLAVYYEEVELDNNPKNQPGLKYDPIEDDPQYASIFATIDDEAEDELERLQADNVSLLSGKGLVLDLIKKQILKKKYGIRWKTRAQLNDKLTFD